jgi:hypothetical protein
LPPSAFALRPGAGYNTPDVAVAASLSRDGRFLIRLCDLVRASSGRNGLICRLPGRGGCLGGPSTKWGGPGRPAGHTAVRSGGARVRFPWPAVAHVRLGWATSRLSGGTILRGCARGLSPPGPAHPFDARQPRRPYFFATLKQSWQEDTDQKFASAASRQVGAYVRGTELIRGFSRAAPSDV